MANKKRSLFESLEETVSDMANAVSVAATGSDISTLELAAEDQLGPQKAPRKVKRSKKRARKRIVVRKKRI